MVVYKEKSLGGAHTDDDNHIHTFKSTCKNKNHTCFSVCWLNIVELWNFAITIFERSFSFLNWSTLNCEWLSCLDIEKSVAKCVHNSMDFAIKVPKREVLSS